MKDTVREIAEEKRGALVTFEGGETLWFSRDAWREHAPISIGAEEDVDGLKAWLLPRQYPEALNYAVSLLAVRARASGEIRQKLRQRRYMDDTIEMVEYKLEKEKLLDDEAFAREWAASCARRQMGKSRILQELRRKGISRELCEQALEELDGEESGAAAVALAAKLLRRYAKEPDQRKAMGKLLSAMSRRGYGYEESRRAVETALDEMEEA